MSSLPEKLLQAGWCYENQRPQHEDERSETYKNWEIITYPELALHYLPTGEYFVGSTTPLPESKLSRTKLAAIKALIDSAQ